MQDVTDSLPHHATLKYQTRPLSDIQNLVVHHTAGPADVGPEAIARYHIQQRGWPGIGYHFVIMGDGAIYQTNRLETISYQAQTANPTSLGIAFAGNLMSVGPTNDQLVSGGRLLAYLMQALGLTSSSIKGHKNFVVTACPGDQWDGGINWRNKLLEQAAAAHPR
jgi:hypothetical protein